MLAWFARYDEMVGAGDLEGMADAAAFPINEVTDDAAGHGLRAVRPAKFLAQMRETVGGAGDVQMESARHPIFLAPALCFVVTDATITAGGQTTRMRYGDLLIRSADGVEVPDHGRRRLVRADVSRPAHPPIRSGRPAGASSPWPPGRWAHERRPDEFW